MHSMTQKPHIVCIPYPAQSHIKAMLKLAKLLHSRGIQITFVNTEYNHQRFLKTGGPDSLIGLPDFQFETIPDGLPPSDSDTTQDLVALCESVQNFFLSPFLVLLEKISQPTCIISDGFMSFAIDAGEKYGIPVVLFWTISACALAGLYHIHDLREKDFVPLKDTSCLTNGYMDTIIDWIPSMKGMRLKDFPSFIRTTNPNDVLMNFCMEAALRSTKASANIIHTFEELEADITNHLASLIPHVYTVGPLQLLLDQVTNEEHLTTSIGYSLWKEEPSCLEWLDSKKANSVLYVNFGSIIFFSSEKLVEFALGLANSEHSFLWIIRPDLVMGEAAVLPSEFLKVIKERGFIASWCPQEQVLLHPALGGFLTHCGWGSTIESLSSGVAMICLPFFADQQTNCRYTCNDWEVGLEIEDDFKRNDIEKVVREFMEGENGKRVKSKAMEWKVKAKKATGAYGSSSLTFNMLLKKLINYC